MSRSRDTSLHGAIARCGKLLGMAALASLLVLSAAICADKGYTGRRYRPCGCSRWLRSHAAPDNTTGGAMYSFDISFVDPTSGNLLSRRPIQ